ncbi:MAG: hypothetical protein Q7S61_06390 [bacterium]|nr:hypothetical protein [bacterium]
MKKIYTLTIILFFLFSFLLISRSTSAQENPEAQAKKYGVTFPVAELDNCTTFIACREYCQDSAHHDACVNFARKKGFYKEPEKNEKKQAMIQAAQTELDCSSEESCRAVCQDEKNFKKCQKFAQRQGLEEKSKNSENRQTLEKAKQILGCDSPETCKAVCEQETNKEKCSAFAKEAGLEGGVRRVGPGGCTSEETCRTYCQEHTDECRKFSGEKQRSPPSESQKSGPGGCDSEESCKKYCEEHPTECEGKSNDRPKESTSQRMIPDTSREEFCKLNPDKCLPPDRKISPQNFRPSNQSVKEIENKNNRSPERKDVRPQETRETEDQIKGAFDDNSLVGKIFNFFFLKTPSEKN